MRKKTVYSLSMCASEPCNIAKFMVKKKLKVLKLFKRWAVTCVYVLAMYTVGRFQQIYAFNTKVCVNFVVCDWCIKNLFSASLNSPQS